MGSLWVIHRVNSLRRPQIDQSANRSTQATRRIQTPICEHGRCQRKVQGSSLQSGAKSELLYDRLIDTLQMAR
jgi:hypothetical protein